MKYDIFISYSREDTETADLICEAFDKAEISYFIDRQDIGGGMEFPEAIAEAIQNSKLMLFLASENSYNSKFVNSEVTFAYNKKSSGTIIPYIIDGSQLPLKYQFTFSTINIRSIQEHPIEPTLIDDISLLLEKLYPNDDNYDDNDDDEEEDDDNEEDDDENIVLDFKKILFKFIKWILIISIFLIIGYSITFIILIS